MNLAILSKSRFKMQKGSELFLNSEASTSIFKGVTFFVWG